VLNHIYENETIVHSRENVDNINQMKQFHSVLTLFCDKKHASRHEIDFD